MQQILTKWNRFQNVTFSCSGMARVSFTHNKSGFFVTYDQSLMCAPRWINDSHGRISSKLISPILVGAHPLPSEVILEQAACQVCTAPYKGNPVNRPTELKLKLMKRQNILFKYYRLQN